MNPVLELLSFLRQHWNTLALVITWVGIGFVYYKRRTEWQRKQFINQVNFSLNYVADNQLAMRTLHETTARQVWLNDYGVKKVFAAADRTTVDNPFIILADQQDQDFINRAVLNVLSERFAETFLAAALNQPTHLTGFCFAITCERYAEIRTLKLRVLIIEEKTLVDLFGPTAKEKELQITEQVYRARLSTLKAVHDMYQKDRNSERKVLGHMQLGVRG